jgi:hypothetical protein
MDSQHGLGVLFRPVINKIGGTQCERTSSQLLLIFFGKIGGNRWDLADLGLVRLFSNRAGLGRNEDDLFPKWLVKDLILLISPHFWNNRTMSLEIGADRIRPFHRNSAIFWNSGSHCLALVAWVSERRYTRQWGGHEIILVPTGWLLESKRSVLGVVRCTWMQFVPGNSTPAAGPRHHQLGWARHVFDRGNADGVARTFFVLVCSAQSATTLRMRLSEFCHCNYSTINLIFSRLFDWDSMTQI